MTPSWYDVLGVEHDADDAAIRAAWRTQIAELDPSDRRFRTLNQAAEVLLDPLARAAHDAELDPDAAPATPVASLAKAAPRPEVDEDDDAIQIAAPEAEKPAKAPKASKTPKAPKPQKDRRPLPQVPGWSLVVAAVAAAALLAGALVVGLTRGGGDVDDAGADQAEAVAVRSLGPVLSYDYKTLDQDAAAARSYLTTSYAKDYDKLFAVIKQNAPGLKAVVQAKVVEAGVVRTGEDRVEVLLFVDQTTTNAKTTAPVVYKNQVTATMVRQDGEWLVGDLTTS